MQKTLLVKLSIIGSAFLVIALCSAFLLYRVIKSDLPQIITVKDYDPLRVSTVYDQNNKKVGEFYFQRRILIPYEKMPKNLVNAFLAAEDDQFFEHGGLNFQAIFRAFIANVRAGRTVQGGSTITQQVAKTFFLSNERKFFRKAQEALLAIELESNLSKEDILFLYLNQIYFGNSAYGIENAAQTYFHKSTEQMTLAEMAILAGLPKAPSEYSPVINPSRAKERQVYVLKRMASVGFISQEEADTAAKEPLKVYVKEDYEAVAPFYLETIRQLLVEKLGEDAVLKKGINIYASLDVDKQKAAQEAMVQGLKELDKRQGFRGALRRMESPEEMDEYFKKYKRKLILESTSERIINPDGQFADIEIQLANAAVNPHAGSSKKLAAKDLKTPPVMTPQNLPPYFRIQETYEAVVEKVDDELGLVYLKMPESQGVIDFESMKWARKPNTDKRYDLDQIAKASQALAAGDVVHVKVIADKPNFTKNPPVPKKPIKGAPTPQGPDLSKYVHLELDQEPLAEGALLSIDQQTQDVVSLVGGYSFSRSKLNRAFQAFRQTGSSFKTIVYASALDKGYTPSTPIMDAPVVYDTEQQDNEGQDDAKVWKPSNHGKSFGGEIIFRNALVQSLNIPSVKILEDVGVHWSADYAKRLGVFSPLNMDFSLALGSSSLSLFEMTKVFSELGRLGKRTRPIIIRKVTDRDGQVLAENILLEEKFVEKTKTIDEEFETRRKAFMEGTEVKPDGAVAENSVEPQKIDRKKEKPDKNFFFENPDQIIKPQTAYVMTSLLKGVIEDKNGTAARAKILGREAAGKTGTTNGYVDAWFIGYTAQLATGVWVGFDKEKSLGKGEVGGRAALPIWLDFMKVAHENLPQMTLPVPEGIVFANIDAETGKLASASSKNIIRQAYVEGTEPTSSSDQSEEATDFLKRDLSE